MRQNISLYLGDMEVEFNQPPEILYTYTQDEISNPTIIKNSFSKTITIVGTNQNNKIFGHFWNLERIQDYGSYNGVYFNASKKTPFSLYVNGDIYESGYAKLSEVRKDGNGIEYDIELYGGLAQFFYGLTVNNDTGNKLKLSDLDYRGTDNTETEFDFTVDKNTLYDAWYSIGPSSTENYLWHYINFAPCYNGLPDIDTSKVLINTHRGPFIDKADSDGKPMGGNMTGNTYGAYDDSYSIGELPTNMTEWEIGDIRSGRQRPVIRMKEIIRACERYMAKPENGSWVVDYDEDFFRQDNAYLEDSWVTLPLLSEMNYIQEEITSSGSSVPMPEISLIKVSNYEYEINGINKAYKGITFGVRLSLGNFASTYDTLYLSQCTKHSIIGLPRKTYYDGAIGIRVAALDGMNNIIAASPIRCLASKRDDGYNWDLSKGWDTQVGLPQFTTVERNGGYFHKVDGKYYWTNENNEIQDLTFDLDLQGRKAAKYVIGLMWVSNKNLNSLDGVLFGLPEKNGAKQSVNDHAFNLLGLEGAVLSITTNAESEITASMLSGSKFNKKILLDTQATPCDYLLSYCKLFGLHFIKDVDSNTIHILTRKNFYKKDDIVNLEQYIDRGNIINIKPTVFDKQWYDFKLGNVDSQFVNDYKNTTTFDYGVKRINTGYNLNGEVEDLYKGNVFKGAIEATEKSKYYTYYNNSDNGVQTWMLDGLKYSLYNVSDINDTTDITIDANSFDLARGINEYKYYDLFSKPQFHQEDNKPIDGSNVLLFYRGYTQLTADDSTPLNYWITDDMIEMYRLNGNSCWVYTNDEYDANGNRIAIKITQIPTFGRYRYNGNNIAQSWDFGQPRQLYIPKVTSYESSTLYDRYWKTYIEDMYDIDNKVLDCYVLLETRPNPEWLRRFYWFDNTIWRLNKISDWSVSQYAPTKMQFIKVLDVNNYSNGDSTTVSKLKLYADRQGVPDSGGTVHFTAITEDGGCWVGDDNWDYYFNYTPSGCGEMVIWQVDIPACPSGRTINLNIIGDNDQRADGVQIIQQLIVFNATEYGDLLHYDVPQNGGSVYYTVKSTYPWSVTSNRNYCIPLTTQGTGNTEVGESIEVQWLPTDSLSVRNATLTFTDIMGNSITAYKAQNGISYFSLSYPYTGGTKTITAPSGATVDTKPDWITIVDNGDGTYGVIAEYNSGDYRSGIAVLSYYYGKSFTIAVEQEQPNSDISGNTSHLTVKQFAQFTNTDVAQAGGTCLYSVKSTSNWTVESDSPYCIPQSTGGTATTEYSTTLEVVWPENTTFQKRCALLTFRNTEGYIVTANKCQEGNNVGSLYYPFTGDTKTVDIDSGSTILTKPSWVTINPNSAGTFDIIAFPNDSDERQGTVVFKNGDEVVTIYVTQEEYFEGTLTVVPTVINYDSTGGTATITITTNDNWIIE